MRSARLFCLVLAGVAFHAGGSFAQELSSYVPVRQGFTGNPVSSAPYRSAPYGSYTGVVVWGDPTDCGPCGEAREDIAAMAAKGGYDVGFSPKCDIWFRNPTPEMISAAMPMPRIEIVESGVVKRVKVGYQRGSGELEWIFDHHPMADRTRPTFSVGASGGGYAQPYQRPVYGAPYGAASDFRDIGRYQSAATGAPMPFMNRALAVDSEGYVGLDGNWHSHGDDVPVASFATRDAAIAAKNRAKCAYWDQQAQSVFSWNNRIYSDPRSAYYGYATPSYGCSSGNCVNGVCYPR